MDFRELLNKLDNISTEAKEKPRLTLDDVMPHVKELKFGDPLPSTMEYSIANDRDFQDKDIKDPQVRKALFVKYFGNKNLRGMLFSEIYANIKPVNDEAIEIGEHLMKISDKMQNPDKENPLTQKEADFAKQVTIQAMKLMPLERDPKKDREYSTDDENSYENITNEGGMKQAKIEVQDWFEKFNKYKGTNGDDLAQGWIRATLDTGIMADAYDENEVEAFNKMKGYKGLDADWQDGDHADFTSNKSGASPITAAMFSTINAIMKKYGLDEEEVDELSKADDPSYGKPDMRVKDSMANEGKKAKKDYDGDGKIESPKDEYMGSKDKAIKKAMGKDKKVKEDAQSMKVNKSVPLAMDSIWDKEGRNPKTVNVTNITIDNPHAPGGFLDDEPDEGYRQVNVEHDGPWTIYSDSGFEKAISDIVGFKVSFTEQGMQENGMASMEGDDPKMAKEDWFQGLTDVTLNGDDFYESFGWIEVDEDNVLEAEYQGRTVKLNKPMRGDVKKFKVYVKNPKGNVVKVNFGDPTMRIKKSNPARRRSFRARHNCDNPGPKTKARYWSCRKW